MLHVMAVLRIQSEHIETALKQMITLAEQSRLEEGCLSYEVFQQNHESVLLTQEQWLNDEAEAAHMNASHTLKAIEQIMPLLASAPEFYRCNRIA